MADNTPDDGNHRKVSEDEAHLSARLTRLGDRLAKSRPAPEQRPAAQQGTDTSGLARGLRLSSELVAGVVVGAGIGWLIDRWLGIAPWGMIVFLLLGFTSGVLNVIRAAGVTPGNRTD